jgi:hypothetical protein
MDCDCTTQREGNTYTGQWSIVLWPEWTRDDGEIEGVLSSRRRREVVSDTLVALICILWLFSQPLEKPLSAMET